jgi:hypothetical protein
MNNAMIFGLAALAVIGASGARSADICLKDAATGPVSYCASGTFSNGVKDEYNASFGPGTAFSGVGIPGTNTQGDVVTGTVTCAGHNFFTINDTSNQGDSNVIYGRFSPTRPATSHGFDSFNGLVFSTQLTPGTCAPPRSKPALQSRVP